MRVVADGGDEATAITYDVSASGLLMACPGKLDVGARVELRFRVTSAEAEERVIVGRVVRLEPREDGDDGPWRYRMAVQFDAPQPELEGVLRAESEESA
jgi:hypothetical protein